MHLTDSHLVEGSAKRGSTRLSKEADSAPFVEAQTCAHPALISVEISNVSTTRAVDKGTSHRVPELNETVTSDVSNELHQTEAF